MQQLGHWKPNNLQSKKPNQLQYGNPKNLQTTNYTTGFQNSETPQ
jgi:hypothetical protein